MESDAKNEIVVRHKYLTLDGIRGVAALAVMFGHAGPLGLSSLPSSYLAVDVFFLMSGFVIAYSYEHKINSGMTFLAFLQVRLIRLYPLYIFGTLIGFTYFLTARTFSPNNPRSFGYLIEAFGLSIFYLPMKSSDPNAFVFPLNGPAWSLFFEMAVNVLYAAFLQRLGTRALSAIIGLSATLLVISSLWYGHLDLGWNWPTLVAGFPRVTFSFFAGVLLYRLKPRSPRFATHPLLVLGLLIAALAIPYRSGGLSALVVLLGFPVLVAAASVTEPGRRLGPGFALLGAISYPIYALHDPLLAWINAALLHWHIDPSHRPWVGWAAIALVISASYLALRVWDEPTRKALTQRFRPGRRVGRPGHSRAASKQGLLSSIDALPKDNPDASLDG